MSEPSTFPVAVKVGGLPVPETRREEAADYGELTDAGLMECFYAATDLAASLRHPRTPHPGEARYEHLVRAEDAANQAFSVLRARYSGALKRRFFSHLLIDDVQAMEQETWVSVCATARGRTARYRPPWHFSTWLFRIARNVRVDHAVVREKADIDLMEALNGSCSEDDRSKAEAEIRRRYRRALEREFRTGGVEDAEAMAKATLDRALGVLCDTFDPAKQQFVVWLAAIAHGLMPPARPAVPLAEYVPGSGMEEALEECELCRADPHADPEEEVIQKERRDVLRKCLAILSPAQQRVVELVWRQEHAPAEAARILRRQVETVYNLLRLARLRLKGCVEGEFGLANSGG